MHFSVPGCMVLPTGFRYGLSIMSTALHRVLLPLIFPQDCLQIHSRKQMPQEQIQLSAHTALTHSSCPGKASCSLKHLPLQENSKCSISGCTRILLRQNLHRAST